MQDKCENCGELFGELLTCMCSECGEPVVLCEECREYQQKHSHCQ